MTADDTQDPRDRALEGLQDARDESDPGPDASECPDCGHSTHFGVDCPLCGHRIPGDHPRKCRRHVWPDPDCDACADDEDVARDESDPGPDREPDPLPYAYREPSESLASALLGHAPESWRDRYDTRQEYEDR